MKSTPRNLMAGMNVSPDQKVGRVHQRAKGLPQDGAHAGGQTYDSSKCGETTSNQQTTTDHDQRLRVRCRKDREAGFVLLCTGKPRTSLRVRTQHIRRLKCACRRTLLQVPQKCRMRATIELISFQFSSFLA